MHPICKYVSFSDQGWAVFSAPGSAAAGSQWILPGHGSVSADWPPKLCCKIPAPGTQAEAETDTTAVEVRNWTVGVGVKLTYIMTSSKIGQQPSWLYLSSEMSEAWSTWLSCIVRCHLEQATNWGIIKKAQISQIVFACNTPFGLWDQMAQLWHCFSPVSGFIVSPRSARDAQCSYL